MKKIIVATLVGIVLPAAVLILDSKSQASVAEGILKSLDRTDGLCVMVNVSDLDLVIGIATDSNYVIHAVYDKANAVERMRQTIDRHNLYGRVSVSQILPGNGALPYADNLVNLLILDQDTGIAGQESSAREIERVVCPYGVAIVKEAGNEKLISNISYPSSRLENGFVKFTKPYPQEMDEWTHFRHDATGNMVANDTAVGPPRCVRWVADPIFQRAHTLTPGTTAMVGSRGRIFYVQDESPLGFGGLAGQWRLIARDAFNGKLLWKRDIGPWGDEVWSWWSGGHGARTNHPYHINKRLVCSADRVFVTLGYNAPVSALDPATGRTLLEYRGTEYADEIVYRDGVLYVSVNDRPQKALPGNGFSSKPTTDNVSAKTICAIEPVNGRLLWKSGPYTGVSERSDRLSSMKQVLLVASEKGVFLASDKDTVVGLNLKDGKKKFETSIKISGKTSAIYHRGMLLITNGSSLSAIDTDTGKLEWQNKIGNIGGIDVPEVFGIDGLVWTGDAKAMEITAWDVKSGRQVKRVSIEKVLQDAGHHHRCYPNKSTVQYLITGRRGAEFTDYQTGEVTLNHWARGECRYGLMPANGLLYKLPDPCVCHIDAKLLYFYALAPERTTPGTEFRIQDHDRLQKGPAFGAIPPSTAEHASEWPQFRHDLLRSSSVKTRIPEHVKTLWDVQFGGNVTPPVVADGRVYVSVIDQHVVIALDESSGKTVWTYSAGGPVDSPPTIYRGMVLFGSTDGWVYCLRARDGQLAWRFLAAPYQRNIMAFNRVESAWPVHGSVLAAGGLVYCTAGRDSFVDNGIYLYALDATTGRVRGTNRIRDVQTQNRPDATKMPEDSPGARSNILVSNGVDIYMCRRKLDFSTPLEVEPDDYAFDTGRGAYLAVTSSFFDDQWFHRAWWTYGKTPGYMLAFDKEATYSVMNAGVSNYKLYVPQGGDLSIIPDRNKLSEEETGIQHMVAVESGLILSKMSNNGPAWRNNAFPIGPFSMVVTEEKLLVAGFRDIIEPADPWGNLEGRKNAALWMLSKQDGSKLAEYPLETLPVWNGMAVANGNIFISLKNGKLICLGQ